MCANPACHMQPAQPSLHWLGVQEHLSLNVPLPILCPPSHPPSGVISFNLFLSGHLHFWFVFGFTLFVCFLLSEVAPKPQPKSVAAPLYNTVQRGDCELLGMVREDFLLPLVRTHPILWFNNTLLKLARARTFVELSAAEEENWIKVLMRIWGRRSALSLSAL